MAKILLVEDDKNTSFLIKKNLKLLNHKVIHAENGEQGWSYFISDQFDLCILDIMLPNKDGLTLAHDIKKRNAQVPFIFLSAKSLVEDKIKGFKSGCDDYITKPFNLEELLLRVDVIQRRTSKVITVKKDLAENIVFGDTELNYLERLYIDKEGEHRLSTKEAELLRLFGTNQNIVLPRTQILNAVWGKDDFYASKSLDVYLTKVRKLFKSNEKVELQNVHGYGYKLKCTLNGD